MAFRLFGRKRENWTRGEIGDVLEYFQVRHSRTQYKSELFDLLNDKVVRDRGIDESALQSIELLRFVRRDDGIASQPLIGAKPKDGEKNQTEEASSRVRTEAQNSVKRDREGKAVSAVNLTDYWPKVPVQHCEVCGTELLRTINTPWRRLTSECVHRSMICLTCLQQHIQAQLEMSGWKELPCPMCSSTLSPDDIQAWCTPHLFGRYGRTSVQQAEHDGLTFRWCAMPRCKNGFLCDPDQESYMTCDACGQRTCLNCNVKYHEGVSCQEFQEQKEKAEQDALARRKQEQESLAEVTRIAVKCPGRGCGAPIQKTHGCDQMRSAGLHIMSSLANGNHMHERSCRHYRALPEQDNGGEIDEGVEEDVEDEAEAEDEDAY